MKIINRVMLSSTLLILFSLILLIVGAITIISLLPGTKGVDLLDKDVFSVEEIINDLPSDTMKDWKGTDAQIAGYEYRLLVMDNNNVVYSSLEDWEQWQNDLTQIGTVENLITGRVNNMTFVAKPIDGYSVFAAKMADEINDNKENITTEFYLPLAVFLLLLVALIVLFGRLLTRKMAWRVLRPLEELTDAAERVKNGNLSVPIAYSGSDEFSYVCTTFNQMQEHLKNEREKNAAYERARIDLIAGLSHDIRTPLTSVKGFIKGLRDGVANTPEKQEQYLSIAYDKACDIDMLLQKLFYFSNLETGKFTLSRTDEDLGVFASEFTESVQNELFILNIEIAADVTSVPHPVQIDTEQMRRVLLNLVENAVKYVQSEPRKITVSVWRENNMEHLLFADNGQGVPEEHLPHLFERFWRGDEARRTQKGDGSGIGLYIARRIVEAHGGRIEALNNNGLQIEIYLPCRKGEHE